MSYPGDSEDLTVSVLIPSWKRPEHLQRCLKSLAAQSRLPDQVIVVWQADDVETRDTVIRIRQDLPFHLDILHNAERGIVPAENLALGHATGRVIALIDDDVTAPPNWLARHLSRLADPKVGAVGGPAINHFPDGTPFPVHRATPIGRLSWDGRLTGNMYDHPSDWMTREPTFVDHLVGYNMVMRRAAFDKFEAGLRPYWQLFELDACLQAQARGYRILFDYSNVVRHYPTNTVYDGSRDGDLTVKIFNGAYNLAFIHAKHSVWPLMPLRLVQQLVVGRVNSPGILASLVAIYRFGLPMRELRILVRTWSAVLAGWREGLQRRSDKRPLSANVFGRRLRSQ